MPVCLLAVELVNCNYNRFSGLLCLADEKLCSNLHALSGVNQNDTAVANGECRINTANEVIGTRSVYDVELGVVVLCVQEC